MPRCGLNRRNCEGVAFSHDVSVLLKFMSKSTLVTVVPFTRYSLLGLFDQQSQMDNIAKYLRSMSPLEQCLCGKRRREYTFLVYKAEVERPQRSNLRDHNRILQF